MAFDFLERVPGELAAVENRSVFGLAQVKQVGGFEHGGKLNETGAGEKGNGVALAIRNGGSIFGGVICPVAQMDRAAVS
jgi:hypothetical protein